MKTMFVLMSHELTTLQYEDAKLSLDVQRFEKIKSDTWSQIPADADSVTVYLAKIKDHLMQHAKQGDILLVQGDFGATVALVCFAFDHGIIPVYATTERKATEVLQGDMIVTTRTFEHVRFRKYETGV